MERPKQRQKDPSRDMHLNDVESRSPMSSWTLIRRSRAPGLCWSAIAGWYLNRLNYCFVFINTFKTGSGLQCNFHTMIVLFCHGTVPLQTKLRLQSPVIARPVDVAPQSESKWILSVLSLLLHVFLRAYKEAFDRRLVQHLAPHSFIPSFSRPVSPWGDVY